MSIQQPLTDWSVERYPCAACDTEYPAPEAVNGSFCSWACFYRHKGSKVLATIENDHRWCASCFRAVKSVEAPPGDFLDQLTPETSKAVIGRQYKTEHTDWVVDERPAANGYQPHEHQRWGCECGTVNPRHRHQVLQDLDRRQTLQSLWACLVHLSEDGSLEQTPARDSYLNAIREHGFDWPLAVGRALNAPG